MMSKKQKVEGQYVAYNECRNPNHSEFIRTIVFPSLHISGGFGSGGVDIPEGKIEIKEARRSMFLLWDKDFEESDWIVGYDHTSKKFYLVKTTDLPKVKNKCRGYRPSQFMKCAKVITKKIEKIRSEVWKIVDKWTDDQVMEGCEPCPA